MDEEPAGAPSPELGQLKSMRGLSSALTVPQSYGSIGSESFTSSNHHTLRFPTIEQPTSCQYLCMFSRLATP
jgi:hypothetical protein